MKPTAKKSKPRKAKPAYSWMNPKLEVRKTKYGKGVFAKENLRKNDILTIFGGKIMPASEEEEEAPGDYGVQISENFVIGNKSNSELEDADYFNHSCNPNAGFHGQIFLVAMRNIKKNEEIVFDYAMVLHRSKDTEFYKMKCLCGAKNCRKYITDDDWKNSKLQKKYNGYLQWYLQNKIDKIKKQ